MGIIVDRFVDRFVDMLITIQIKLVQQEKQQVKESFLLITLFIRCELLKKTKYIKKTEKIVLTL